MDILQLYFTFTAWTSVASHLSCTAAAAPGHFFTFSELHGESYLWAKTGRLSSVRQKKNESNNVYLHHVHFVEYLLLCGHAIFTPSGLKKVDLSTFS